jgi:hypothetical protein
MIATTLIAMTSAGTISFEYEIFEFMFVVVMGDAAGHRCPPNAARRKSVPQTLDLACFGEALGDATEDALTSPRTPKLQHLSWATDIIEGEFV